MVVRSSLELGSVLDMEPAEDSLTLPLPSPHAPAQALALKKEKRKKQAHLFVVSFTLRFYNIFITE